MSKIDRSLFRHSVTLFIARREVLYAVRGLSMAAQREVNNRIPWAAATDEVWTHSRRVVKFHFTSGEIRSQFLEWVAELVKAGTVEVLETSDTDPAPESE